MGQKSKSVLVMVAFAATLLVYTTSTPGDQRPRRIEARKKPPAEKALTRADIRTAEEALADIGYWTGPVDGTIDDCSRHAIVAFQKINGLEPNGKLTRAVLDAILASGTPEPLESGSAYVEVDIAKQVLFFVDEAGDVSRILPVSTGNNEVFRVYGELNRAYTPRGRFSVYLKGSGWQESPLGLLYYPSYLIGGIAIHGNPAVPPRPESHGCIRVPMCAARAVADLLPLGTKVVVHDGGSLANGFMPWPDDSPEPAENTTAR